MAALGRDRAVRERSEEAGALVSAVLAVTASGASIIAIMQVMGGSLPFVAVPTAVLLVALARGLEQVALWAAVAVWVLIVPLAHGHEILAPLMMIVLCATLVIGPERVLDWIARDWSGHRGDDDRTTTGWIEDDWRVH